MLGPVAGGSVRLFPIGDDGHLGIAEGIETALAAQAIFGVPTWAALSADGLARWQWPDDIKRVTIFADAGDAGQQAAAGSPIGSTAAGIAERDRRAAAWRRLQRRSAARRGAADYGTRAGREPKPR